MTRRAFLYNDVVYSLHWASGLQVVGGERGVVTVIRALQTSVPHKWPATFLFGQIIEMFLLLTMFRPQMRRGREKQSYTVPYRFCRGTCIIVQCMWKNLYNSFSDWT